uniref:Uncharacterized protein n=1 Tax=Arundo donax TaxID=35708 RepID=A0A0A9C9T9_ARUDO
MCFPNITICYGQNKNQGPGGFN